MKVTILRITGIASFAIAVVIVASSSAFAVVENTTVQPANRQVTRDAAIQEKKDMRTAAKEEKVLEMQDKKDARDTAKNKKACERLDANTEKLEDHMIARQEKLQIWQEGQTEKVGQRKEQRAGQLIEKRSQADARRAQHYADLVKLGDTAEKKAALVTYGDAVDAAVESRRDVIDENLALFWGHSQEIIIGEKKIYADQDAQFVEVVDAAIAEAEAACAVDGADAKEISKQLRTQLKAGQDQSKALKKETKGTRTKIGGELQIRRQAINEATKEFKEQIRVARVELVEVFGSDIFGDDEGSKA